MPPPTAAPTTTEAHLVDVPYYELAQLQAGDRVLWAGGTYVVTGHSRDGHVPVETFHGPGRRLTLDWAWLTPQRSIRPGPGRTAGLRDDFWTHLPEGLLNYAPARPRQTPPAAGTPGADVPLTVGGGLSLRLTGPPPSDAPRQPDTALWLSVPGYDFELSRTRPRDTTALNAKLAVAAALDGGLTDAGQVLHQAEHAPGWQQTWTRAVAAHFGLAPDDEASTARAVIDALAPTWTGSLDGLAAVLSHLDAAPTGR